MASLLLGSVLLWVGLLLLALVGIFWVKAVWWVWWRPRRLERFFREQGMEGSSYRFPFCDVVEERRQTTEAQSSPMPLSHDIMPRVLPWVHSHIQKHGKFSFSWLGPHSRIVINDSHVIRDILFHNSDHVTKMRLSPLIKLVIPGFINYEGEKWAKHKRIINPAFHLEKLKLMVPAFLACCTELIDRWENMVPLEGSCELDVWPEFQNFSGDVISRTAFGSSYDEGRRIFQLQAELAGHFVESFAGSIIPGYRFLPTKRNRRMKAIDRELKRLLRNTITEREKATQSGTARNDDLLGLLLESNRSAPEEDGDPGKSRLTTEEVIEECRLFYFAGQETTSSLLTWTVVVLSMHQTWQDRAREEVLRVFGGSKPEFQGLSQLKVVSMVLQEVLRLYPPLLSLFRLTQTTVKLGEFCLPPGVVMYLSLMSVHRDPEIWGDDAHEFKPERFSEGFSKASKNQAAYLPFGSGPRICIGQNFAMVEAKLCLAMILQRFRFELSPSYAHAPRMIITLQPQYGAQIVLHKL